ncbi:CRTAC1 family protein [Mesorhizobium sp. ES1-6]|uniref:CRTAC1 family protein n=1 Tax=Mesorhizobium sp. ES1-6 TaxID=2876626 RepID=UPI001CCBD9A3|nr:CRTAC1 family protein [Mesorhizobium sp. ES1-6]MBZ9803450.1 CRTAC1 family protein [Mesorhizobium sp. ES1-6]
MRRFLLRHAAKIATLSIALALYLAASPGHLTAQASADLAAPLRLSPTYLQPADTGRPFRTIRDVNPSLRRIDGWISSVGAGIALADIQGTGLPADICLVDPRNDSVTVLPAPQTGDRFAPFALEAPDRGFDSRTIAPMGCLPADANEDGRMDLVVYYWGRTPVIFLRNDRPALDAAGFTPIELVDAAEIWNTNAAILADVDGDGHPDLVFGNYFRDGDRVLDALSDKPVAMQHSMSRAENGGRNGLFLWQYATKTSVAYRDASTAFTDSMADGWTLALAARDLDDASLSGEMQKFRGLPEIYVANDFGNDRLLLNRSSPGNPHFQLVEGTRTVGVPRSKVLGLDSFKGMGADFGDLVGDGRPALAVSNISSPYALLESNFLFVNNGDDTAWLRDVAPYVDRSTQYGIWTSGWGWDVKFADLLNSGRPAILQAIGFLKGTTNRWPELQELAMGNDELLKFPAAWPRFSQGDELSGRDHDRLFLPTGDGKYSDVWNFLGLDSETVSRGIATGDVYGDGRLSVAIARQWSPSLFLRNRSENVGKSIVVDLRVPGAVAGTRPAIGAEASVTLSDGRVVTSVVDGGSGHAGKRAPEIHLGLGKVASDAQFDVQFKWRSASGQQTVTMKLTPGRHRIVLGGALAAASQDTTGKRGG